MIEMVVLLLHDMQVVDVFLTNDAWLALTQFIVGNANQQIQSMDELFKIITDGK